jgi:hypothetical protein
MGFALDPLSELGNATGCIIKQEVELLEVVTGCETKNRYNIYIKTQNGLMTYLFKAKEDSGWCVRNCLQ